MNIGREIDHLVYVVKDLEAAMIWFEIKLGCQVTFGGYHTTQGTKNALINLGNQCYLEILAIDGNTSIPAPRWMGIDVFDEPQLTRWSLKSTDLQHDSQILKKYNPQMGEIKGGQRKTSSGNQLTWEMIMPLAKPAVEIIPFMTDWQQSAVHPTGQLPEECELIELELTHSSPHLIQKVVDELHINGTIKKGNEISIKAKIKCPNGIILI